MIPKQKKLANQLNEKIHFFDARDFGYPERPKLPSIGPYYTPETARAFIKALRIAPQPPS